MTRARRSNGTGNRRAATLTQNRVGTISPAMCDNNALQLFSDSCCDRYRIHNSACVKVFTSFVGISRVVIPFGDTTMRATAPAPELGISGIPIAASSVQDLLDFHTTNTRPQVNPVRG